MQPSKAFWEAAVLVGILLVILLISLWSLGGWSLGGAEEPPSERARTPRASDARQETPGGTTSQDSDTPAPTTPTSTGAGEPQPPPQTSAGEETSRRRHGDIANVHLAERDGHQHKARVHLPKPGEPTYTVTIEELPKPQADDDESGSPSTGSPVGSPPSGGPWRGGPPGGTPPPDGSTGGAGGGFGTGGGGYRNWGGQPGNGGGFGFPGLGGRTTGGQQDSGGPQDAQQQTNHHTVHIDQETPSRLLFNVPMSGIPWQSAVQSPTHIHPGSLVASPIKLDPYYVDIESGSRAPAPILRHRRNVTLDDVRPKASTSPVDVRFRRTLSLSDPPMAEAHVMDDLIDKPEPLAERDVRVRLEDGTEIGLIGPDGKPITVPDGEKTGVRIKLDDDKVEIPSDVIDGDKRAEVVVDGKPATATVKRGVRVVDPKDDIVPDGKPSKAKARVDTDGRTLREDVIEPDRAGKVLDTESGTARARTESDRKKSAIPVTLEDASDVEEFFVVDKEGKRHRMLKKKKKIPVEEEVPEYEEIVVDGKRQKIPKKRENATGKIPLDEESDLEEVIVDRDGTRQKVRRKVKKGIPVTVEDTDSEDIIVDKDGRRQKVLKKREKAKNSNPVEEETEVEEVIEKDGKRQTVRRRVKKRIPVTQDAESEEEEIIDKNGRKQRVKRKPKLRGGVAEESSEEEIVGDGRRRKVKQNRDRSKGSRQGEDHEDRLQDLEDELGLPAGSKARRRPRARNGVDNDDREDAQPRSRVGADPTRSNPPQLFNQPIPQQIPIPVQTQQAGFQPQLAQGSAPHIQQVPIPAQSQPAFQQVPMAAQGQPAFHNMPSGTPAGAPVVISNATPAGVPMPISQGPSSGYQQEPLGPRERSRRSAARDDAQDEEEEDAGGGNAKKKKTKKVKPDDHTEPDSQEEASAESKVAEKTKVPVVPPAAEPEPIPPEAKVALPEDTADEDRPIAPPMEDLPTPVQAPYGEPPEVPPIDFLSDAELDAERQRTNSKKYRLLQEALGTAEEDAPVPEGEEPADQFSEPPETVSEAIDLAGSESVGPSTPTGVSGEDVVLEPQPAQVKNDTAALDDAAVLSSEQAWKDAQPLGDKAAVRVDAPGSATQHWSQEGLAAVEDTPAITAPGGKPTTEQVTLDPQEVESSAEAWQEQPLGKFDNQPVSQPPGSATQEWAKEKDGLRPELPRTEVKTEPVDSGSSAKVWESERPVEVALEKPAVIPGDAPGSATEAWRQEREDNLPSPDTLFEKTRLAEQEKLGGQPVPAQAQNGPSGGGPLLDHPSSATEAWNQEREDNLPSPDTLFEKTRLAEQEKARPKESSVSPQTAPSEDSTPPAAPRETVKSGNVPPLDPFKDETYYSDPERESGEKPHGMGPKVQAPEVKTMNEMAQDITVEQAELDTLGPTTVDPGLDTEPYSAPVRKDSGVGLTMEGHTQPDAAKQAPLLSPVRKPELQEQLRDDISTGTTPEGFGKESLKEARSPIQEKPALDPLVDPSTVWGEESTEEKTALLSPIQKAKADGATATSTEIPFGAEDPADVWGNSPTSGDRARNSSAAEAPAPLHEEPSDSKLDASNPVTTAEVAQDSNADVAIPVDPELQASPKVAPTFSESKDSHDDAKKDGGYRSDGSDKTMIEEDVQEAHTERYDSDSVAVGKDVDEGEIGTKQQKEQKGAKNSIDDKNKLEEDSDDVAMLKARAKERFKAMRAAKRKQDIATASANLEQSQKQDGMPFGGIEADEMKSRPMLFASQARGRKDVIDADLLRDPTIMEEGRESRKSMGVWHIIHRTWHIIGHAPVWSFFTLGATIVFIEGDRQLAQLVINSSSAPAPAQKRAEALDLALTDEINKDFSALLTPGQFFVLLNLWNVLGILIISLMLSGTITHSQKTTKMKWTFSVGGTTHSISQFVGRLSSVLLMGARASSIGKFLWPFSFVRYARLFLFLLQLAVTTVVLQQSLLFAAKATGTSSLLDSTPDPGSIGELAQSLSPGYIFAGLNIVLAIVILTLTFGWFALLNPAPTKAYSVDPAPRKQTPRSATTVLAGQSIGAIVIITVFLAIMYFFSEISIYVSSNPTATQTSSNLNIILANAIFFIFTPALGWSLIVLSRVGKKLCRSFKRGCFG